MQHGPEFDLKKIVLLLKHSTLTGNSTQTAKFKQWVEQMPPYEKNRYLKLGQTFQEVYGQLSQAHQQEFLTNLKMSNIVNMVPLDSLFKCQEFSSLLNYYQTNFQQLLELASNYSSYLNINKGYPLQRSKGFYPSNDLQVPKFLSKDSPSKSNYSKSLQGERPPRIQRKPRFQYEPETIKGLTQVDEKPTLTRKKAGLIVIPQKLFDIKEEPQSLDIADQVSSLSISNDKSAKKNQP